MAERPSGSARTDLLIQVLVMGQFEKNSDVHGWEGCELCEKKFKMDAEVIFRFPRKISLSGTDLPFDIQTEMGKLCLPCLMELGGTLANTNLEGILTYAKARYEKDYAKVYVPQAIVPDEAPKPATS